MAAGGGPRDVIVRPVTAEVRPEHWRPAGPRPAAWSPDRRVLAPMVTSVVGASGSGTVPSGSTAMPVAPSPPVSVQLKKNLRVAWRWWLLNHLRTARALRSPGRRRRGLRRLAFCAVTDFAAACLTLFLVAMIVSPFLGI